MECPACQRPRYDAAECPYCGVVYERFRKPKGNTERRPKEKTKKAERARPRLLLSLAKRETLLLSLAQALEAGITAHAFSQGPMAETFPVSLRKTMQAQTQDGIALSKILSAQGVISRHGAAILEAGEIQGKIPGALRVLAEQTQALRSARQRLLMGLAYPTLLLVGGILVRPLPKLVLGTLAAYLQETLAPLTILALLFIFGFYLLPRLDLSARFFTVVRLVLQMIPPLGTIAWHHAIANFADTLSACITAGINMRQALNLAAEATGHNRFSTDIEVVLARLDQGETLVSALEALRPLAEADRALIGHGEQVGRLDEVLPRLAADHKQRARTLTLVAIVLGVVLSVTVVFVYLIQGIVSGWSGYLNNLTRQIDLFTP